MPSSLWSLPFNKNAIRNVVLAKICRKLKIDKFIHQKSTKNPVQSFSLCRNSGTVARGGEASNRKIFPRNFMKLNRNSLMKISKKSKSNLSEAKCNESQHEDEANGRTFVSSLRRSEFDENSKSLQSTEEWTEYQSDGFTILFMPFCKSH